MYGIVRNLAATALAAGLLMVPAAIGAHPSIDIVASNWKFTPSTIELHVGETTTIRLTSSEGVHGLESPELGITKTTIVPGQFTKIDVTPKQAGKYVLHCAILCGAGHADMALTANVVQ
ncbi:MAG: cupredoxin domain-containing protein [Candidatus Eremiobacteraeota bacterium]|nr:cupredoxin domain-containing protein [Candidatus Eremiobacteraeota bacterium]